MSGARAGLAAAQKVTGCFAWVGFEGYLKFISEVLFYLVFTLHVHL